MKGERKRKKKEPTFDLYIGQIDMLCMDPTRLKWKSGDGFLSYTFAIGRNLLQTSNPPPQSIFTEWHGILPPKLNLKHGNVWNRTQSKKEGTFIWSI